MFGYSFGEIFVLFAVACFFSYIFYKKGCREEREKLINEICPFEGKKITSLTASDGKIYKIVATYAGQEYAPLKGEKSPLFGD
jgi:hypothetical protein